MKKIVLLNVALLFIAATAFGENSKAQLFSYDKKEVRSEFAQLNQLEQYVNVHEGATLSEIQTFYDAPKFAGPNRKSSVMSPMFDFDDMDWGSFAWGLCCCPVGVFTVALNDSKSSDEKTSYWIGVISSAVICAIIFI